MYLILLDTIEKNSNPLKEESRWLDGLKSHKTDVQSHDQEKKSNNENRKIEMSKDLFYYNDAVFGILVETLMRGHGGRVVTLPPLRPGFGSWLYLEWESW